MPTGTSPTVLPPGHHSPPATSRLAVCINEAEAQMFFPGDTHFHDADVLNHPFPCGNESWEDALREFDPEALLTSWSTPHLSDDCLETLPSLRYICHTSGAVRQLVPRSFLEKGGMITNWGTLAAETVAEHALLLILAGLRRLPEWPAVIAGKGRWQPSSVLTKTLFGKRVGLHGFGNVALALAKLLRPFGVSISAYTSGMPDDYFFRSSVTRCASLEALFAGSDVLVECEALTPQTQGIVNRPLLKLLPLGALFVNVGRGAIADETALADLAREGRLRLALDVFAQDPIAVDSPLHEIENAVLSPHIAGPTSDQFHRFGDLAERNIHAFFSGQPLEALVTLDMYDRMT